MAQVIRFHSRLFDTSLEQPNPYNPIPGTSMLAWLRERVPAELAMTETEAEDWGWYTIVDWRGRHYMVGSCAFESEDGNHEWVLQVEKHRSTKEKLLGREKMQPDDPCFLFLKGLIEHEPAFTDVSVD